MEKFIKKDVAEFIMITRDKPLELRVFCSPKIEDGNKQPACSILRGVGEYLELRGIPFKVSEKDYGAIKDVIEHGIVDNEYPPINSTDLSQINADEILKKIAKEKVTLVHGPSYDNPHWSLIILPDPLVSVGGRTIYGKSTNYVHQKDSLASIIVSTFGLNDKDPLLKEKAFILGKRFALLTEGECFYSKCLGSGMDYRKLERMARNYKKTKEIFLCQKHKR